MSSPKRHPMADSICMACGADGLDGFYRAGNVPVHSVILLNSSNEGLNYPRGDIDLAFCSQCGFIQNRAYDPDTQEYGTSCEETQAFSEVFGHFATELARGLIQRYGLGGKRVVEVGCGKGDFLVLLARLGLGVGVGIDPGVEADRIPEDVRDRLQLIPEFFAESHIRGEADLLVCRHTLEHIQNVADFVRMTRLGEGGENVPVFYEVPAAERVLSQRAFWDIYYEHCSYFSRGTLLRLFQSNGFIVEDLDTVYGNQYHLLFGHPARSGEGQNQRMPETELAILRTTVADFRDGINKRLLEWRDRIRGWASRGHGVVLWGSGSKAVSFLTTLGIGDEVAGVVDINPFRQGRYLPGTGHRILAPEELPTLAPNRIVIMNPMYTKEVRTRLESLGLFPELIALS
jgi:SAM-dependent methyltransferase